MSQLLKIIHVRRRKRASTQVGEAGVILGWAVALAITMDLH